MFTCMQKKVKIESNSPPKSMWTTCMQKKVEIKSNTIQNTMVITCMNNKAKIKSNSIQNIMNHDAHLHAEEGEDRVKLPQNSMWITCIQKRLKIKSLLNGMDVTCMQMEGQRGKLGLHTALSLFLALIAWLASMKLVLQSIFMSTRCVHRSHFQSGFLN